MSKYNVVFVLVNYKTENEIIHFIDTLNVDFTYRIVCVNNYSNNDSLSQVRILSKKFDFDLIENKNTGYGNGNNIGIEYALKRYNFEFLIVSNCDIEILKLSKNDLFKYTKGIIAPTIKTLDNRLQNPMYKKRHTSLYFLFEISRKLKSLKSLYLGVALSKFFAKIDTKTKRIYAAHGSFIIFTNITLKKMHPIFDNEMFLFCEELVLAEKAFYLNEPIYYDENMSIKHFEDASMNEYTDSMSKFNLWRKSYKIFYSKYFLKENLEN